MGIFDDATQQIDYGPTLPPVCGPNVGRCFFLTTDTVDGRGLYICTALNTWTHLAPGGVGPVLPPGGTEGDVYFVTGGVNIGIWQYIGGSWTLVNGGVDITAGPTTFTDFSDARYWLPIGCNYITRALATTGMTLTGNTARALHWGACGVVSLFRVFGDDTTGDLEISVTFDSYSRVTDHFANDEYLYGVWLIGTGRGAAGADDYVGAAYGGLSGGNQDFVCIMEMTLNNFDFGLGSTFPGAPPAATTFTITLQASDIVWTGSTCKAISNVAVTYDGGGGPLGGAVNQAGGYIQMPTGLNGFRLFVGAYHTVSSNTAVARATGVTVTTGRVVGPL